MDGVSSLLCSTDPRPKATTKSSNHSEKVIAKPLRRGEDHVANANARQQEVPEKALPKEPRKGGWMTRLEERSSH